MVTRGKENCYIMIKGSIHQENKTIVNIYIPNIGAFKYSKQILTDLKRGIDNNTIIVGNFNTPLSTMDKSSRQKINKETLDMNCTLDQMDLTDMKNIPPKSSKIYILLNTHGTFSRIDICLATKAVLTNVRRLNSYQLSFPTAMA